MPNFNPGPQSQGNANAELALENIYGLFSVTATLTAGPLSDLGAPTLWGYSSGSTTRLLLTPASGGTTINGIDASGVTDGFTILIVNQSATDNVIFTHQSSSNVSPGNQFTNLNGGSVALLPFASARATYVVNAWRFA